jgi:hypothetical protein
MKKNACFLILLACVPLLVIAQDASEIERQKERQRLDRARGELDEMYKADKRACYQMFDVNGCLIDAREKYLKLNAPLRKDELAYQANERQIKAQEAASSLADRNSEENQIKAQQQRDESVKSAADRRHENAQKQFDHATEGNKRPGYEKKQKEALDHRKSVEEQISKRDKPASAPLPVPPQGAQ